MQVCEDDKNQGKKKQVKQIPDTMASFFEAWEAEKENRDVAQSGYHTIGKLEGQGAGTPGEGLEQAPPFKPQPPPPFAPTTCARCGS